MQWGVLWTGFDSDGFGLEWLSQTETFLLWPSSQPPAGTSHVSRVPGGAEALMVLLGEFHAYPGGLEDPWVLLGEEFLDTLRGWNTNGC